MTRKDALLLLNFANRMGMFITPVRPSSKRFSEAAIVAFVHGYEIGRNGKCSFSRNLSMLLEQRHQFKVNAVGWPDQINRYSKRLGVRWDQAFVDLTRQVASA